MSLSSFLLKSDQAPQVDSELDALFRFNTATTSAVPSSQTNAAKIAPESFSSSNTQAPKLSSKKRTKVERIPPPRSREKKAKHKHVSSNEQLAGDSPKIPADLVRPSLEDIEDQQFHDSDRNDSDDSDHDGDAPIIYESLRGVKKSDGKGFRKIIYVPPDETPSQRDSRTIFIGNLPVVVAQKKSYRKQLQRHILTFTPTAKIESTRFRSVPFQTPTSTLPTSDHDETKFAVKRKDGSIVDSSKHPREHSKDRASAWRDRREEDDPKADQKKFLTPQQKKKIAFINQDFHSEADTMNAYIVFAHSYPTDRRPSNVPAPPPCMDPYEAARLAAEKADGTLFMERMLRVDVAEKSNSPDGGIQNHLVGDPKLSIFVGNLDFASAEEDLRAYFEGVVAAERGPPPQNDKDSGKLNTWVTRVRVVRDKETQLGKGFAYVQFADRECVDELLSLEEGKLKFAKRKLRVRRCKVLIGGSTAPSKSKPSHEGRVAKATRSEPEHIVIPKGDPSLGERIATLSKDQRKKAKASDAGRVARRLAKKKARNALGSSAEIKLLMKDRVRARKGVKKVGAVDEKKRKGRIRSERSVAKRNTKK